MDNKKTSFLRGERGNTKLSSPLQYKKFVFTLNNYSEKDIKTLKTLECSYLLFGYEGKGEGETPHLQGMVEFDKRKTFAYVKKNISDRIHVEKLIASKASEDYCKKEGDWFEKGKRVLSYNEDIIDCEYKDVVWRDWQLSILESLKEIPSAREVAWYWDNEGNIGKSYLCKYIALTMKGVIIAEGKKNDIYNEICKQCEKGNPPKIVIIDAPRTSVEFVSYTAIEQIKNGLIFSGKYEGGVCAFKIPHVICFANIPPKMGALSQDRWNIIDL